MRGGDTVKNGKCGEIRLNNFHSDLQYSIDARDDEQLDTFYREAFPLAERIEFCAELALQKRGIDKIVHFKGGNSVTVDEKKRRRDYGDILLELRSNKERGTPGWLFYAQCDYIVYAVLAAGKVYLLPTLLLKMAWRQHGAAWVNQYEKKYADNGLYRTENIAIPTGVLLKALSEQMVQAV